MTNEAKGLASVIDHTLLKPEARWRDIEKLCAEAREHGFYSVCVNGMWVSACRSQLQGSGVRISAVCGFPLGAMSSFAKAKEAEIAARDGAEEIDMVLPVGALLDGDHARVKEDIRQVVEAVKGAALVKVILETGFLSRDQIVLGCRLAEEAGADFVKTSTGFGPGGAKEEVVRLMRASVSGRMRVKASGGIRDAAAAARMLEAGADRLGTSSGVAIVTGLAPGLSTGKPEGSGYWA